jgi:nicotinate dehydrogenase subunit A
VSISTVINGVVHGLATTIDQTLLDLLRNDCGLTATRFGCGEGLCGACHVLVDGSVMAACNTPIDAIRGKSVTTLEGLGNVQNPHPLQQAFIDEQAMQCGYCISGILITAVALLTENTAPTEAQIRKALDGNLCRCGSHNRIIAAIQRAAEVMRRDSHHG